MDLQRKAVLVEKLAALEMAIGPALAKSGGKRWFTGEAACPLCGSRTLLRSHRRNQAEHALSLLALPFRCDDCGRRFFVLRTAL